MSFVISE